MPLTPSYGVYISQQVRFARVYSKVSDFNDSNLHLTGKLLHRDTDITSFFRRLQNSIIVTKIYKNRLDGLMLVIEIEQPSDLFSANPSTEVRVTPEAVKASAIS